MFCSLVLLIKTINTFVICIWGYISFISRNIDKKKNKWLRLRWLRQRLAEAETETSHVTSQSSLVPKLLVLLIVENVWLPIFNPGLNILGWNKELLEMEELIVSIQIISPK